MAVVYVLDKRGSPLMPTGRCGHVRELLKSGRALVHKTKPFTIRLKYDLDAETQRLILGIDPGRTNIGVTTVDENATPVLSVHAATNNKDVPKRMKTRKSHRQASRNGRRKRRQRRAKKHKTVFKNGPIQKRKLPGYEKPIELHYIRNKEARFLNRKRPKGWLTPTAKHLLESHINLVKQQMKLLPISDVVIELNKFAFMALDNPDIKRWEYQNGPLKGHGSVEDAVSAQQDHHCIFCGAKIEHYHHIVPLSKGGSDTFPNIVGLCKKHHQLVHTSEEWAGKLAKKKAGQNKKYGALSVLNQIIPYLVEELEKLFPGHVYVTDGRSTKAFRDAHGIEKNHHHDAYCIACSILDEVEVQLSAEHYEMMQFRRHDRAATARLEERKYYLDGVLVAKNRHKRTEQVVKEDSSGKEKVETKTQPSDSLEEFRKKHPEQVGRLTVVKGHRVPKDTKRILPGAVFLVDGEERVLYGRHGKVSKKGLPAYYEFVGMDDYITPRNCTFIQRGGGWTYI